MLLTEEEAREKQCHRILASSFPDVKWGCIGSACMAWRWRMDYPFPDDLSHEVKPQSTGRGYCGLASVPERE